MTSLILRTATRYLFPIIMLFSIYALLRGHNEPGGGFVGGLAAASAYTLYALAFDVAAARNLLRIDSRTLIGLGLLLSLGSALFSFLFRESFMTGIWGTLAITDTFKLKIGTPVFFDIGVYCVVLGVTLTIILALSDQEKETD
jgi:multicomponent Na+:H+ antiporter subunit B